MKKLRNLGIALLAALVLLAGCANPFVGEDGEVATVSGIEGSSGLGVIELSWTEPDVDFAQVEISFSSETDTDNTVVTVDKGTTSYTFEELTGVDEEYTFVFTTVTSNGVKASKTATFAITEGQLTVADLAAAVESTSSAMLTWTEPDFPYDSVTIDWVNVNDAADNGSVADIARDEKYDDTDTETEWDPNRSYEVTGLTLDETYTFEVTIVLGSRSSSVSVTSDELLLELYQGFPNIYTFGPELVGGWPGQADVAVNADTGLRSITFAAQSSIDGVILNGGGLTQTGNIAISAPGVYLIDVDNDTVFGATDPSTVIVMWADRNRPNVYTFTPEAAGGWPGTSPDEVKGIRSFDTELTSVGGVILNGTGQTGNMTNTTEAGYYLYTAVDTLTKLGPDGGTDIVIYWK